MKKYIVRPGDTMWSISKRTGVRLNLLMAANPQYSSGTVLTPGQIVMIPELTKNKTPKTTTTQPAKSAPVDAMPVKGAVEPPSHHGYQPIQQTEPAPHYFGFVWPHVVRQGETWEGIAQQYGVSQEQLQHLNPNEMPSTLKEGDILYVPALGPYPGTVPAGPSSAPAGTTATPGPGSPGGMPSAPGYPAPSWGTPPMPAGGMAGPGYAGPGWPGGMMPPSAPGYPAPGYPVPGYPASGYPVAPFQPGMMGPQGYPGGWPTAPTRGFETGWGWPYYGWADEVAEAWYESASDGQTGDNAGE